MAGERVHTEARGEVPELDSVILRTRNGEIAVRVEDGRCNRRAMACKYFDDCTRANINQSDRLVVAARYQMVLARVEPDCYFILFIYL